MTGIGENEIALSDAAQRLGLSWERAWRLLLSGALTGRKDGGRWLVSVSSVEHYLGLSDNRSATARKETK